MAPQDDIPEEHESLELDKLEVSSKARKDSVSVKASEEGTAEQTQAPRASLPKNRPMLGLVKNRGFILSLIAGAAVSALVYFLVTFYRDAPESRSAGGDPGGIITYAVSSPVGFKYHVTFRLRVPFKDPDGKWVLLEKLPAVRSEIAALAQNPDVIRALREKDLDALKAHLLQAASDVIAVPVTDLELDGLVVE